nr:hypothetical protein [uncultured Kosakonia sp.]
MALRLSGLQKHANPYAAIRHSAPGPKTCPMALRLSGLQKRANPYVAIWHSAPGLQIA